MPENKLLDLSFEFAVAIVHLLDGVIVIKKYGGSAIKDTNGKHR